MIDVYVSSTIYIYNYIYIYIYIMEPFIFDEGPFLRCLDELFAPGSCAAGRTRRLCSAAGRAKRGRERRGDAKAQPAAVAGGAGGVALEAAGGTGRLRASKG